MMVLMIFFEFNLFIWTVARLNDNLGIAQFIKKYKYPVEVHSIKTEDGYILKLFRIPHCVSNTSVKEVALLVHGMGGSAENFLLLGPPDGLAFYLADRGYDVWLFNARGTIHSRKHSSLNPIRDRKSFWNFSWHEIGTIDLPTSINYILMKTGTDKLFYAGHSQGATSLFVMLSEIPEMNDKIQVAALLAPAALLWYTHSPLITLVVKFQPLLENEAIYDLDQLRYHGSCMGLDCIKISDILSSISLLIRLLSLLNWYELTIPNSPVLNGILQTLCNGKLIGDICMDVLALIGGSESGLISKTLLPTILQFSPSGFATKQAWHYSQVIASGDFKQYDYGKMNNLKMYNSTTPPTYELSKITAPIGIFYALEDPFGNKKMAEGLSKILPNMVLKHEIEVDGFNHIDFLFAQNIGNIVYDPLYSLFQKFKDDSN